MVPSTLHIRLSADVTTVSDTTRVHFAGAAFYNGHLLSDPTEFFAPLSDASDFLRAISALNGFYHVIVESRDFLWAAVDRNRSRPLFCAHTGSAVYVSDDPYWIQQQLGGGEVAALSAAEFVLTGYVTGASTLDPRISQLQAGEALCVSRVDGQCVCTTERYYRYQHACPATTHNESLCDVLDDAVMGAVLRLVAYANGRQIVLPLSGGLDSRLVALALRRHGYHNVVAYSYGVAANREAEISRLVAQQLGLEWHFIEYSDTIWRRCYGSAEWQAYVAHSSRLVSTPHIQDWPALLTLRASSAVSDNAVFVPGHSADFLAGSHIPRELDVQRKENISPEAIAVSVRAHHYSLTTLRTAAATVGIDATRLGRLIADRIIRTVGFSGSCGAEEAINYFETWDWQERQAKFIINSVRAYEQLGYTWWLPWWDGAFMGFWEHVPLSERRGKRLYDAYVARAEKMLGVELPLPIGNRGRAGMIRGFATHTGLMRIYIALNRHFRGKHHSASHPLGWYAISDGARVRRVIEEGGNINTLIASDHLAEYMKNCSRNSSGCKRV